MRCIADTAPRPSSGTFPFTPPPYDLRGFRTADLSAIVSIVSEALHEYYESSLYYSLSQQWSQGFLVATDSIGQPVGFLLGVIQSDQEARVLMFAVDRQQREKGVGSILMSTFLDRCRERGLRRVTLEVRVSNAIAIRFYTRYRFSVVDLLRGYYSDGENGYQMARDVS